MRENPSKLFRSFLTLNHGLFTRSLYLLWWGYRQRQGDEEQFTQNGTAAEFHRRLKSMQSRVIVLVHDDVGLVVLPAGMYRGALRYRNCQQISASMHCNWVDSPSQKRITCLIAETSHQCVVVLDSFSCSIIHMHVCCYSQCVLMISYEFNYKCHRNPSVIPVNPG